MMRPSSDDYARGGIIQPRDHGDDMPAMLSPGGPAEWASYSPRRLWRYPASQLTRPRAFQVFRAYDEFHNSTIAVGVPWVGMWVFAYPRRLNTVLCGDQGCQEPTCEFYRQQ